ncbi:MAG TPA: Flp pilus assembly protein CpaB [Caulobacteraceae bacterium]|jgi:pilus assembly protein CpaB
MRMGTMLSLGASALLGLLALVVARVWLPSQGGSKAQAATPVATVPVVVAAQAIPYGGKLEAKHLAVAQYPKGAAPDGSFTAISQILGQQGGAPIALMSMQPKEPVLRVKLSGSGARPTLATMITPGMRAFTIGVSEVAGGGGHILPGDRVDVVLTREVRTTGADGAEAHKFITDVVLQNVRVLGMDLNVDPNSTKASVAKTATMEVDVKSAEKLALAAQAGNLSLALRSLGAADIEPVRPLVISDLSSVPASAPKAARAPARRSAAPRERPLPPPPFQATVVITHGDAKNTVSIPVN